MAEVLHGPLQLVPLGLPLLIVAHILSSWALPGGCPGVVVHVVKPPSGVRAFFPPWRKRPLPGGGLGVVINIIDTPIGQLSLFPSSRKSIRGLGGSRELLGPGSAGLLSLCW